MKFGLSENQYDYIQITVCKPLTDLGAKIYCYGSRARGTHTDYSDLDLMVESDTDLNSKIGFIKETLTKSNFPLKVDLVQLVDFAQSYKKQFETEKIPF